MAGSLPRPEGTDDDEAWRMGWTNKEGTNGKGGVVKGGEVSGSEDEDSTDTAATTRWPKTVAAAATQPAVLPAPVFGATVGVAAPSAVTPSIATMPPRLSTAALDAGVVPRKPGGPAMRVYLFMVRFTSLSVLQVLPLAIW